MGFDMGVLRVHRRESRKRTAARMRVMRELHRNLIAKYVSMADNVHTNGRGPDAHGLLTKDTQERREAVQEVRLKDERKEQ